MREGELKLRNRFWMLLILCLPVMVESCDSGEAPDCIRVPGTTVTKEIRVDPFDQVVVYGRVKVFIAQGQDQQVLVKAGENLIGEIQAEVKEGRLSLRDLNTCTFFQTTHVPEVHIRVPELSFIENAGNQTISGVGTLNFPVITLRSNNYDKDPEVYTNGDFRFSLRSETVVVSGDDHSNFYLSGSTGYLRASFWAGDGRLEAGGLVADSIRIFHRGTNKMILHPILGLRGEIRSTGDVIAVERPLVEEVRSYYTGKLIYQ